MKKRRVVKEIAKKTSLPPEEIEITLNSVLDTIVESLLQKEPVSFIGFGSFIPVKKRAREISIPSTNKKVLIETKYGVKFKPSKFLKFQIENSD